MRQFPELQIIDDLAPGPAAEVGDLCYAIGFFENGFGDFLAHQDGAGGDAFGNFEPKTMQELFIKAVADALPVINHLHDLIITGIPERLVIDADPYDAPH